jgi:hypothetical protein
VRHRPCANSTARKVAPRRGQNSLPSPGSASAGRTAFQATTALLPHYYRNSPQLPQKPVAGCNTATALHNPREVINSLHSQALSRPQPLKFERLKIARSPVQPRDCPLSRSPISRSITAYPRAFLGAAEDIGLWRSITPKRRVYSSRVRRTPSPTIPTIDPAVRRTSACPMGPVGVKPSTWGTTTPPRAGPSMPDSSRNSRPRSRRRLSRSAGA